VKLFQTLIPAEFKARPNRFLVECMTRRGPVTAYLPNPGRLRELLLPGRKLYLVKQPVVPGREIAYMAVAVERDGSPILLHTHLNNHVARHLIEENRIPGLDGAVVVKAEHTIGNSRFDFLLRKGGRDMVLEVKSCTLFGRRIAMFPDAITERGRKHILELASLSRQGTDAAVLFLVHTPSSLYFMPDYHTDLLFSRTLLGVRDRIQVVPVAVQWYPDLSLSTRVRLLDIPWDYIEEEAQDRGSYMLVLRLREKRNLRVGQLGIKPFGKGFYIYVGSAMANLTKRIERHVRKRKLHHWHIDELRDAAEVWSTLVVRSSDRLECEIARRCSRIAEWSVPGFGCSDCSCDSHLFGFTQDPFHSESFHRLVQYFRMDRFGQGI